MRSRHPIGLYVLFFTEMWERFGFYCMESVFVYYMKASRYEFLRENSSRIYGLYLAGVYFTPFVGGLLSEWWFGYSLSILLGGALLAGGYALLSLEPAVCFGLGLAGIILGNGLFKPNISSLVGKLYPPGDPRIDSAFNIFYMGINVGALFSPIVAGMTVNYLANTTDWEPRYGYLMVFAIAAVGMLVGEAIYLTFRANVRPVQAATPAVANTADEVPADVQRRRNVALALFFGINILFWMAFKQRANSMALWIANRTDLAAPDWLVNLLTALRLDKLWLKDGDLGKELFQALNPLFVILFTPQLVWVWGTLRAAKVEVSTPAKLVIGFALTAGAFAIMWRAAVVTPDSARAPVIVILAFYVALTLGELCLSPMGLSLVSKLAPARTRAVWMGGFFASVSVGGYLAGEAYQLFKDLPFAPFFKMLTFSSLGAMALMLAAYPLIAAALRPVPSPAELLPAAEHEPTPTAS
jgi:POT family proton-dependent oligopeptide transporter